MGSSYRLQYSKNPPASPNQHGGRAIRDIAIKKIPKRCTSSKAKLGVSPTYRSVYVQHNWVRIPATRPLSLFQYHCVSTVISASFLGEREREREEEVFANEQRSRDELSSHC